jgi:hypothetical protein
MKAWIIEYIPSDENKNTLKQGTPIIFGQKMDKSNMTNPFNILVQNASSTAITSLTIDFISESKMFALTPFVVAPDKNMFIQFVQDRDRPFPQINKETDTSLDFPLTINNINMAPGEYFQLFCRMNAFFSEEKFKANDFIFSFYDSNKNPKGNDVNFPQSTDSSNNPKDPVNEGNRKWYIIGGSILVLLIIGAAVYYHLQKPKKKMSFHRRRH